MERSLVILAAGLGSRFGGAKQLEAVGPDGATIMEYTVFDALRAGFGRVVLVIRPEMRAALAPWAAERFGRRVAVHFAEQRLDELPGGFSVPVGRTKPWGTGQAVLAAASQVCGPFAVANADDFYGAAAMATVARFLGPGAERDGRGASLPSSAPTGGNRDCRHGLVGFRLLDTLSEHGTVNRGVCRVSPAGELVEIEEVRGIERDGSQARVAGAGGLRVISGDTLVSMNLWGYAAEAMDVLRGEFEAFLKRDGQSVAAEFQLPTAIQSAIRGGRARVRVLPSPSRWFGLTHREDLPVVRREIARLIDQGAYPRELWA